MKTGQKVRWVGPGKRDGVGVVTFATWENGCYVQWPNGKEEPCYNANLRRV